MAGNKWLLPAAAFWLLALFSSQSITVSAQQPRTAAPLAHGMFAPSSDCMACHNSLVAPTGEDLSIGTAWRASIMANSARDPYWQASVRRESIDHKEHQADIEDECSICHMPMVRAEAHAAGKKGQVFAHLPLGGEDGQAQLAEDGVSCALCHQITPEGFGTRASFVGGFVLNKPAIALDPRTMFGPFAVDPARQSVMHSVTVAQPAEGKHIQQSELCATCHTLITQAFGPNGEVIGSIPEQVPYQEWLHSDFKDQKSCQACHMPRYEGKTRIASVLGEMRDGLSRHSFVGGNFLMLRMLNRFRTDLAVAALPQELETQANATIRQLQQESATVNISRAAAAAGRVDLDIDIRNLTGHKLPSGYPSRRAWLHVTLRDRAGRVVFESGGINPDGHITGNDNDADGNVFEPHYEEITRPEQVQIYESVMQDRLGKPTTGLLHAIDFAKDNRLLPRGFDKATASEDIAVHGGARGDADFTGGADRIRYLIDAGGAAGPFTADVELRYQSISYRWAHNLSAYDAPEPKRFVGYYDELAPGSSTVLAHATATTP